MSLVIGDSQKKRQSISSPQPWLLDMTPGTTAAICYKEMDGNFKNDRVEKWKQLM